MITKKWLRYTLLMIILFAESTVQSAAMVEEDEKEQRSQEEIKEERFTELLHALAPDLMLRILDYAEPRTICDSTVTMIVPRTICDGARTMAICPEGKYLATHHDNAICIWDIHNFTLLDTIQHRGLIANLQISSNKKFVTALNMSYSLGDEGAGYIYPLGTQVWDVVSATSHSEFHDSIAALVSPDNNHVVTVTNDEIVIKDSSSRNILHTLLRAAGSVIKSIGISNCDTYVAARTNHGTHIWDMSTGALTCPSFQDETPLSNGMCFSNDDTLMAIGNENAEIRDVRSGELLRQFTNHPVNARERYPSIFHNNNLLITARKTGLLIRNILTGESVRRFRMNIDDPLLAFNGTLLITRDKRGTVTVWKPLSSLLTAYKTEVRNQLHVAEASKP